MDALDDVVALAECPQDWFGAFRQVPSGRPQLFGQPEALKLAHAPDQGRPGIPVGSLIALGAEIDDAIVLCRLGREHTIELGPAVGFDLGVEATVNVEVASWAEFKGWGCSVFQ